MPEELKIGFYITLLLVGVILYKKKAPRPTRLDLSGFKNGPKAKSIPGIRRVVAEVVDDAPDKDSSHIFLHQGRKYNALKVLNVPLGAGLSELKRAYALKLNENAGDKALYLKAYNKLSKG